MSDIDPGLLEKRLWDHDENLIILGFEPRLTSNLITEQYSVAVYGSPSINGRELKSSDLGNIAKHPQNGALSLDGEFIAVITNSDEIIIIGDRFASIPVFHLADANSLVISFSYQPLWQWQSSNNQLDVDPLAFYEFLHFQRLFGESTFDKASRALPPAGLLRFNRSTSKVTVDRFWLPNFAKRTDGLKAIAGDLADAVKESVKIKTSGANKPSLLLSGGMDSRLVLGGFAGRSQPHCITVGEIENNEVDVARELANISGAKHSFVGRSADHYSNIISSSVAAGGGMYSFQHGHFYDLEIPATDLIVHGHGFDYFFQGMYLPSSRRSLLGRSTRMWSLNSIGTDIPTEYIKNAKYRMKGVDSLDLLKPEHQTETFDRVRSNLESVLAPVNGTTAEPYDDWDYLTTSAPGRHYTYLNLLSAASLAEQRTVAFTNDIFDIYYSTPADVRHGTMLLAQTIKYLDPRFLNVRNANTNLRPDLSPLNLTTQAFVRGLKRRLGSTGKHSSDPSQNDRSWPIDSEVLNRSKRLTSQFNNLKDSPGIESLGIFDQAKIEDLTKSVGQGDSKGASAILSLLTIEETLASKSIN